eukprot:gene7905-biopygen22578
MRRRRRRHSSNEVMKDMQRRRRCQEEKNPAYPMPPISFELVWLNMAYLDTICSALGRLLRDTWPPLTSKMLWFARLWWWWGGGGSAVRNPLGYM